MKPSRKASRKPSSPSQTRMRNRGKRKRRLSRKAPPPNQKYTIQLRQMLSALLPARGLLLIEEGKRWTDRLLVMVMLLMAFSSFNTLADRFVEARDIVGDMYKTRRRTGWTYTGFTAALALRSDLLLGRVTDHLRRRTVEAAGSSWKVGRHLAFGVDGTKSDAPRTQDNEEGLQIGGKRKSGPQHLVVALQHLGTGFPGLSGATWPPGPSGAACSNCCRPSRSGPWWWAMPVLWATACWARFRRRDIRSWCVPEPTSRCSRNSATRSRRRAEALCIYGPIRRGARPTAPAAADDHGHRPAEGADVPAHEPLGKGTDLQGGPHPVQTSLGNRGILSRVQADPGGKMLSKTPGNSGRELDWTMAAYWMLGLMLWENRVEKAPVTQGLAWAYDWSAAPWRAGATAAAPCWPPGGKSPWIITSATAPRPPGTGPTKRTIRPAECPFSACPLP